MILAVTTRALRGISPRSIYLYYTSAIEIFVPVAGYIRMNTGIHAGQVSRLLLFILTIDRLLKSTRRGRKSILFFILSVFHANVSSIQYSKKKKVEKLDQFPRGKTTGKRFVARVSSKFSGDIDARREQIAPSYTMILM